MWAGPFFGSEANVSPRLTWPFGIFSGMFLFFFFFFWSVLGSPKEYLETFIFPILLPGMASLLHQAKKEKCFEVSRFIYF